MTVHPEPHGSVYGQEDERTGTSDENQSADEESLMEMEVVEDSNTTDNNDPTPVEENQEVNEEEDVNGVMNVTTTGRSSEEPLGDEMNVTTTGRSSEEPPEQQALSIDSIPASPTIPVPSPATAKVLVKSKRPYTQDLLAKFQNEVDRI